MRQKYIFQTRGRRKKKKDGATGRGGGGGGGGGVRREDFSYEHPKIF